MQLLSIRLGSLENSTLYQRVCKVEKFKSLNIMPKKQTTEGIMLTP
jgi:hypothetical protein